MLAMKPLVTLIVPIYNVEQYIDHCLKSILYQEYKNIECLFIDDCGQDKSIDICRKFIRNYQGPIKFSIIKHDCNKGLSAARNTGIFQAQGEYLYFLDSDDFLFPNSIGILVEILTDDSYDMVIGNFETNISSQYPSIKRDLNLIGFSQTMTSFINGDYYVMAWNKLIKKEFLLKNELLFNEGIIHEDLPWMFKCINVAEKIRAIKDITYHYFIRSGSIATDKNVGKHLEGYKQGILDSMHFMNLYGFGDRIDNYTELAFRSLFAVKMCIRNRNISYLFWFVKMLKYCISHNPLIKSILTKSFKDKMLLFLIEFLPI